MEPLTRGERALAVAVAIGGLIVIFLAVDLLTGMRFHRNPVAEATDIARAAVND